MGRHGPKPKPTAIKLAKGETRPSRVNYDEPELPEPHSLAPPAGLVGEGRRIWSRLAVPLKEAGILRDADLEALEDYCRALTELRVYEAAAKKAGPASAIKRGLSGMVVRLRAQSSQLRAQLGLTPSSRTAVKATRPPEKLSNDHARFFGALRGLRGGKDGRR